MLLFFCFLKQLDLLVHAGAVRLYVVLDTSILLSRYSFIQAFHRNLGQDGAVPSDEAGSPAVQLLLVVPWAVLVELDKLKEEQSVLRIQGVSIIMFVFHFIFGSMELGVLLYWEQQTKALDCKRGCES